MEIIHQSNLDSQRSTELAKLEARVAELRAALGKGCISCAGCPYADICNKKIPTESNEDARPELEPGLSEDSDDVLNLSAQDYKNKTTSFITASANVSSTTLGRPIETLRPAEISDSKVDKLAISNPSQTNIIVNYEVQIVPDAPLIDSRRFREPSHFEDNVILSTFEKKAVTKTECIPTNDEVKSSPTIESFVDLPIRKHPAMDSPIPIKLHRDISEPSIEEKILNISLPTELIINQQPESLECSDALSPTAINDDLIVETIPYIEGLDLIYEPARPVYVDYLADSLTKDIIDEESLVQLKIDGDIISDIFVNSPQDDSTASDVESFSQIEGLDLIYEPARPVYVDYLADSLTKDKIDEESLVQLKIDGDVISDIFVNSLQDDSTASDVESTPQNVLESEEISLITATDNIVVNRHHVNIDYILTRVYQNIDSYSKYIGAIASIIARLALSLTFKKIPFALL